MLFTDDECLSLLEEFAKDPEPIVSQSCEVALSMLEFEKLGKSFEVRRTNYNFLILLVLSAGKYLKYLSSAVSLHAGP